MVPITLNIAINIFKFLVQFFIPQTEKSKTCSDLIHVIEETHDIMPVFQVQNKHALYIGLSRNQHKWPDIDRVLKDERKLHAKLSA